MYGFGFCSAEEDAGAAESSLKCVRCKDDIHLRHTRQHVCLICSILPAAFHLVNLFSAIPFDHVWLAFVVCNGSGMKLC